MPLFHPAPSQDSRCQLLGVYLLFIQIYYKQVPTNSMSCTELYCFSLATVYRAVLPGLWTWYMLILDVYNI